MQGYAADIEGMMQRFFSWLSEKDRRYHLKNPGLKAHALASCHERGKLA